MTRPSPRSITILIGFAVCYAFSLTFVYVEGDDAASIAYHALGRIDAVQGPYAEYQRGMDFILEFLPPDEHILRVLAISVTAIAALLLLILMMALAVDMLGSPAGLQSFRISLVTILAMPEVLYLGMVYTPVLVGMCAAVGGHLLVRRSLRPQPESSHRSTRAGLAAGLLLLILAPSFRWEIAAYWIIVLIDYLLIADGLGRLRFGLLGWAVLLAVGLASVAVITIAAVVAPDPVRRFAGLVSTTLSLSKAPDGLQLLAGSHLSVFTPAVVAGCVYGGLALWRHHRRLGWFTVLSLTLALLWPLWMSPKSLIVFAPIPILVFVSGMRELNARFDRSRYRPTLYGAFAVLLLAPWFVGFALRLDDSAWGPAFELQPIERKYREGLEVGVRLGSGAAIPTREGPRPLWGHAYVLFGGEWRDFVSETDAEVDRAISAAVDRQIPLVLIRGGDGWIVAKLAARGMTTSDPGIDPARLSGHVFSRGFHGREGSTVTIVRAKLFESRTFEPTLSELIDSWGFSEILLYGYPATLRTFYLVAPDAVQPLGKRTAIVDLSKIRAELQRRTSSPH